MKKTRTIISLAVALLGTCSFAGAVYEESSPWNGFYIGANAGYLWSSSNRVTNTGLGFFANSSGLPASRAIAFSLAELGRAELFGRSNGAIGGGQIGYNSTFMNQLVIGLEADLDGIGQSNNNFDFINTFSPQGLGTYNAHIVINKKLDYMGALKGRLGFLISPSFLIYGAGGYSYGGASLKSSYSITSTSAIFSPINEHRNKSTILSGWNVGGGVEWLFYPAWSMKLEYTYYNLGPINTHVDATQFLATTPPVAFATATLNTLALYSNSAIRVGVNYHFC